MWTIVLTVIVFILYRRISSLEKELKQVREKLNLPTTEKAPSEGNTTPQAPQQNVAQKSQLPPTQPVQPSQPSKLWEWISDDWPLKAGALLIILGFSWLVTYAFLNNWVGPVGRITFGLVLGAAILYGGHKRLSRFHHQGLILELLGGVIMLISVYAAQNAYDMFSVYGAAGFSLIPIFFLAYSSLIYKDKWLATAGLILGGIVPMLTGSGPNDIINLYAYLTMLCIGTLWLVRFSNWQFLTPIALVITSIYSFGYFDGFRFLSQTVTPSELLILRFFAITLSTIFFMSNIAAITSTRKVRRSHLMTGILVGLFMLGWINGLVPTYMQGLIATGAAVLLATAATLVFKATKTPIPVYVYSATSLLMFSVAATFQFDGPTTVVALAALAVIAPILANSVLGPTVAYPLFLYYLLPVLASLDSIDSRRWFDSILHNDFYALFSVTLALWISGFYLLQNRDRLPEVPTNYFIRHARFIQNTLLITASVYSLLLLWLTTHAVIRPTYFATLLSLAVYIVIGLFTYFKGIQRNMAVLHRYGQILTLLVIARLLIIEVWDMVLAGRIITFLAIGALLVIAALVQRNKLDNTNEQQ